MKYTALLAALAALLIANQSARAQGALTPPGAPAESQKSLQEIWDRLDHLSQTVSGLPESFQSEFPKIANMVTVVGGTLPVSSEIPGRRVAMFHIGKHEVTWDEWQEVRSWAVNHGYSDLADVGAGTTGSHPVRDINWYDAVKWCNAKSEKDGLSPVYYSKNDNNNFVIYRSGISEPSLSIIANGYRLPSEPEWEWAALGGVLSKGYSYSGSNNADAVAWYSSNSQNGTMPVGLKEPNELGIFDMSGNVWEFCEDVRVGWGNSRNIRGGDFSGPTSYSLSNSRAGIANPTLRMSNLGFRIVRSY